MKYTINPRGDLLVACLYSYKQSLLSGAITAPPELAPDFPLQSNSDFLLGDPETGQQGCFSLHLFSLVSVLVQFQSPLLVFILFSLTHPFFI